jgi:hypothetical protein
MVPPTSKIKVNVLNLSDKVKVLDLLQGGKTLAEVRRPLGEK